ncbi:MAG: M15 family metallopeptidase [Gammaproteobacteria bacterium]|nr:M15 family metallopeptidase [Gammaproteobacteria bacterium]MCY4358512.1 M15 family metallopeptidase [Gammaproteobacteria bacterium]
MKISLRLIAYSFTLGLVLCASSGSADNAVSTQPEEFVAIPADGPIRTELRYFTANNFVGERVLGYQSPTVYMTQQTYEALLEVAKELAVFSLGLKVFDAYRPQRAVDHFVRWARELADVRMKSQYYPRVDKANLISEGYIANRSGHSRGSTVDLTLIDLVSGDELDMGTPWDFFDSASWGDSDQVTAEQRANRALLRIMMTRHGFNSLREEWWHFTLADEPFPETYFDFPVQ